MRTSGEKVRISDEAERVQSVSYPHIRWLSRSVMDFRIGQIGHGLGPCAFWGPAQLFPITTQY